MTQKQQQQQQQQQILNYEGRSKSSQPNTDTHNRCSPYFVTFQHIASSNRYVFIEKLQALSILYCQSTWMSVCGYVCVFEAKYLEN